MSEENVFQLMSDRGWVTLREFSKIADVTYQTALRWAHQKRINYIQVGGTKRVYQEEIRRFLTYGTLDGDPTKIAEEKNRRDQYLTKHKANKWSG